MTKTGKRMAIVTLEDMTGSLRMVCFSGGRAGQASATSSGRATSRPTTRW